MSRFDYVVVGLGASGYSATKYLLNKGAKVAATDSRKSLANLDALENNLPLSLGDIDAKLLAGGDCIVLSPGVPRNHPKIAAAIAEGKRVIGDVELFAQDTDKPVIAITGTNAKSTVTTLVGQMAKAADIKVAVGGNIGTPALDLLSRDIDLYVLELSSYQLESIFSLSPAVACVLNVTPDHLDRYDNFSNYAATKRKIYQFSSIAVYNFDDLETYCDNGTSHGLGFTLGDSGPGKVGLLKHNGKGYLAIGEKPVLAIDELYLVGRISVVNSLAALAIGAAIGFPIPAMVTTLKQFRGLPHRCQLVRELNGVRWINDSKGTNVGATVAAISGLGPDVSGSLVVILGGQGKDADFSKLVPVIKKYVSRIILIGESSAKLHNILHMHIDTITVASLHVAVETINKSAQAGDMVLLSPACASFDMFESFEHRGNVFIEEVSSLE